MDDILASIRRIIADDDALPLSRSARAAATTQPQAPQVAPPPPAATATDAFMGLGQRLFRGADAAPALERPASAFRPPAPRPGAAPQPFEAAKAPALKLRDFAPSEPQATRPAPHEAETGASAAKNGEPVKPAAAVKIPDVAEIPDVAKSVDIAIHAAPAKLVATAQDSPVTPTAAAAPTSAPAPDFKSGEPQGSPEAPKLASASGAAVLPLTSIVASLAEARMKVAPSPARAPAKAELPAAAPEAWQAPEASQAPDAAQAPEPAQPAEAVASAASEIAPARPASRRVPAPQAAARHSPETGKPLPETDKPSPERAASSPHAVQTAPEAPQQPLLSPATGARIGASFEALAESLMLRDPEMIERVAREMLRPMLKSWLDDNLPIVVERLVRAEIERIARGRG